MPLPRARVAVLVALLGLLGLLVGPVPSASAAGAGWADLTFEGSANDWTGTVRQSPVGFPAATFTSDSAAGSAVGRQSGASTFLGAASEVGERYGSSRGRPYLNLRPYAANGAGVPGSSTTTYRFDAPTPTSGWTFVLGDVDADQVTVSATGPDDAPVDPDDLGFRSAFNACGPGSCAPNDDVPSWDADAGTLTGNAGALDTNGAAAWFEPRVPLTTLTFVFMRRAGFPVYQTWFAAQSRTLSGTVDAPDAVQEGLTVALFAPDGRKVAETTTDADGDYRFSDMATYDGYGVGLVRPTGYTSDGPLTQTVRLGSGDRDDVDFSLREIVPVAVSGGVFASEDGRPLPGIEVNLNSTGPDFTTVTGADGGYSFDTVPEGAYQLSLVPPPGTSAPALASIVVPPDSEEPITQNLTLYAQVRGTAKGTVTFEGGAPAAGVRVTVNDTRGTERVAVTDAEGRWSLDLPQADYDVAVVPPDGFDVIGGASSGLSIPTYGGTYTIDFVLSAPVPAPTYGAGGTVVDEAGMPFPDVTVTVADPDGQPFGSATTAEDGTWQVDGLLAGEGWTATVEPPDGYEPQDEATLTFTVDDADVAGLDFVLQEQADDVSGSGSGSDGSSGSGSDPTLAATGGPGLAVLLVAVGATTAGTVLLRRPRRR